MDQTSSVEALRLTPGVTPCFRVRQEYFISLKIVALPLKARSCGKRGKAASFAFVPSLLCTASLGHPMLLSQVVFSESQEPQPLKFSTENGI